jgi:acetyltransferase-like isoleucine patch superfamily enzyme
MYRLQKLRYLARVLRENPSELVRLLSVGGTTLKYRYLKGCVGRGTIVGPGTKIINSARVRIGRSCLIQDSVYIRAGAEGSVTVGDRCAMNSFTRLFGHGSIQIGDDTQLGPGSLITTTDHDYGAELEVRFRPVVVGKRVWIGANVTVLPGVTIGDRAVIGAGSVVTKDIGAGCVAVGVPARVVKEAHGDPAVVRA